MGTSQSFKLKTTPNWSSAKKAMTEVTTEATPESIKKFLIAFSNAVSDTVYRGKRNETGKQSGRGRGKSYSFGKAGSRIAQNFLGLVSGIKDLGVVDFLGLSPDELQELTAQKLLYQLYDKLAEKDDANPDDEAAKAALDELLAEVFNECEEIEDFNGIIQNANQDMIDGWLISYNVSYIIEYNAELFQTHIFSKEANPERVFGEIKRFLKNEVSIYLGEEMHNINIFSLEGRQFVDEMTGKILDIWQ